jgi:SAM-dependent methyltransferase
MAKWILKAIVQKTISYLPYKEKVNFFFQKYVTKGVYLNDEHFKYKLDAARDHIRFYNKYGNTSREDAIVLELGTGWYPIVPTILFLADFKETISIDISNWMSAERQIIALAKILDYFDNGLLSEYATNINLDKVNILRDICNSNNNYTIDEINEKINLRYEIMDATKLSFDDRTFDFICSNNTFEHIYVDVLQGILKEFKRVLKPNGIMSHFIDLSDHFAHMDGSINIYNFLRFSKAQWNLIDNSIQPQNRLRWKDYLKMYSETGITIKEEEVREGSIEFLSKVPLHTDYEEYSSIELAISHGYIVS